MARGVIFDIKEFAVHDGPGVRTTVFLKGCPLRCSWCHNPEGISPRPQAMYGVAGERVAGREMSPQELAGILRRQAAVLVACEGGVTFSGGEPLMQAEFVAETVGLLEDLRAGPSGERLQVLLDTSGYASERAFRTVLRCCDLVYFDLKLMDPAAHRRYTGVDTAPILRNLAILAGSGVPFVIRVPLIPGVTDTDDNLAALAQAAQGLAGLLRVDLLSYNKAAGGKYRAAGMVWRPDFDESRPLNLNTALFEAARVKVCIP